MISRFQLRLVTLTAALCISLLSTPLLRADHISFAFSGSVQSVFDGLGQLDDSVEPGTVFSGAYTFDPDTPNTAEPGGEGESGLYEHDTPPAGVTIDIGNFTFRSVPSAPDFDVIVNNDFGFAGSDDYGFISHNNEASGLPLPGLADRLDLQWLAQSFHDPFSSVDLPLIPPDLSLLGGGLLTIFGECTPCAGPAQFFEIRGTLTSLTPEPSTGNIFLSGVVILTICRRRNGAVA